MSSNAETPRSRSKLTKALVATGVGVALLAGGGGTFAKWYDSEAAATDTTISSGALSLETGPDGGTWWSETREIDPESYLVVPGETLTFTQDLLVSAKGDRLTATLSADIAGLLTDPAGTNGELLEQLEADARFTVNDIEQSIAGAPIVASASEQTYRVELEVTFEDSVDQGTTAQNQSVVLTDQLIELRQGDLRANG